ncbi:agamous-like MADS-box protein MADS2 isoform X2 [Gossypium hirsutum]|uniref:Agamous-like MADS-box protein MADS2 isoform X2 n=1 Tax=Gossypium hirsutum TaxID=3635 RepID=A0A1U8I3Q8_GOSHI|nr:agamous-like MADS-box protein MADS2 isoform X2 [Gossypium hirsutum]
MLLFEMPMLLWRNLLGEDLGLLNSKELEQLEHQLEPSLKHVRSTKERPWSYMVEMARIESVYRKVEFLLAVTRYCRE